MVHRNDTKLIGKIVYCASKSKYHALTGERPEVVYTLDFLSNITYFLVLVHSRITKTG
jgi:hypothetical protein